MRAFFRPVFMLAAIGVLQPEVAAARQPHHHHYKEYHDNSAAAGALIGLAIIGVAAAASSKRDRDRDGYYRDRSWGVTYSPAQHITCYRDERQCYKHDHFSYEWTEREFGYDPYRRRY